MIEELFKLKDEEYKSFTSKLIPNISKSTIIGVRVPILRKYTKEYIKNNDYNSFLNDLPHKYYEENMIHSLILSSMTNLDECLNYLDKFLPYIDNWSVCDILSLKVFKKVDKQVLLDIIKKYIYSNDVYTCRFGIKMLMTYYLDDNYKKEYLDIPLKVKINDYYVNMMIAWFYATALAKRYNDTLYILKDNKLDIWIHNKTIQKSIESYRISQEKKNYLKTLKR
jgi:3-methyladenine DNA glycosylase AlkD